MGGLSSHRSRQSQAPLFKNRVVNQHVQSRRWLTDRLLLPQSGNPRADSTGPGLTGPQFTRLQGGLKNAQGWELLSPPFKASHTAGG